MRRIQDYLFKDKKALIRVDFNVPLDTNHRISDTGRIDKTLPTIQKTITDGGSAILLTHMGRPKQGYTYEVSLQHIVPYLREKLNVPIHFSSDCIGPEATEKADNLAAGEILVLENVRFHPEEEINDPAFAQALAALGDVYINDAFGTLHRQHASIDQITHYMKDKLAGFLLQQEIDNAQRLLQEYTKPFTLIVGGTKVADKLPAIEALLDKIDHLLIGGGVANTFQYALGGEVGQSVMEPSQVDVALTILHQALEKEVNILLPVDVVIANQLSPHAQTKIANSQSIPNDWMAVDLGPHSRELFQTAIQASKTILWTGPVGLFEIPIFQEGSLAIIEAVARATKQGAFSLIGGGDSATAVSQLGHTDHMSFISTGGGALLAYLANPMLPTLRALT